MGTVPDPAAPTRSAKVVHELERLTHDYGGTWVFDYVDGAIQPWRAERSEAEVIIRPMAYTAVRAEDATLLRRAIESAEWIDTRDTGR